MSEPRTFTARWVFPVAGSPLENGTVTIRGDRIEAVQPQGERTADEDLGNVAIVPGLVNPHTHLDLSGARGLIPPTDPDHFTDWLRGVIAYRRSRSVEQVQADIRTGLAECLRFGTTLIGDIAAEGASWDEVTEAKTRAVLFWELIGLEPNRIDAAWQMAGYVSGKSWEEPPAEIIVKPNTSNCKWALSPHAPYTVNAKQMQLLLTLSPLLATHIAESPNENDLLSRVSGPFVDFLQELGVYREEAIARSWEAFLTPLRNTSERENDNCLLVHGNYLPLDFAFRANQSIVYCPRTHAAFGHPPHPFLEFLRRGVRVCLGTDSLASNPDLDILAEARFVHEKYPDFPGDQLLRMITLSGAEALGWASEAGSLEPGKSADFVTIPLPNEDGDPHELLFHSEPDAQARAKADPLLARRAPSEVRRTMFLGQWRS